MDDLKDKRVTVAGLGRFGGGITAAQWLCRQRAKVLVTDTSDAEKLADSVKQLEGFPVEYRLGGHDLADFADCDLVVASPAIPPTNAYLRAARDKGVPVTTEMRLFLERCPLPVVAVSGTKGKSTTSTLLSLMLQAKYRVWLGGNIGKSLLFDLPEMREGELVLLELSSFMLEYLGEMRWSPRVALLTMLGSDHVEWHGSVEAYHNAKMNLIRYQTSQDSAILWSRSDIARQFTACTKAKLTWYDVDSTPRFDLQIPGEHNQLNAQAAFAAARQFGVTWQQAQDAVRNFTGLAHRLNLVHEHNGIRFYDDSIATIAEAAAAALLSFPKARVIQIVGGHDKQLPLEVMADALGEHAKAALCIGETAAKVASLIHARHPAFPGVHETGTLENALTKARELASPGDVVLLSTGCSSYDQFDNFQQRGHEFARLAKLLFA